MLIVTFYNFFSHENVLLLNFTSVGIIVVPTVVGFTGSPTTKSTTILKKCMKNLIRFISTKYFKIMLIFYFAILKKYVINCQLIVLKILKIKLFQNAF